MKVFFSPQANLDLMEIGDWIALDNRQAALKLVREIQTLCESLVRSPHRYPLDQRAGFNRAVHGRYLIFYRIKPQEIQIARILHSARDRDVIFGDGEP